MTNHTFEEVSQILQHINGNNTIPRNIRRAADESNKILFNEEEDEIVRASAVVQKLDEISNDPNIPVHARTLIYEILAKLEGV
ncbi:UPF0147 family protein [Methanobrevibacter curvatus]|uniref:UPF0147 protein MBCUR_02790 n=1 Tax=Methanobrevibacter curvatus TaxID=49547 RepID=A0A166D7C6_9EURY|nr:UPF0147 family protein [Methanobrevibacter curvatus]KZX15282.1 hypothetical protein MBCUR_02790 [Methanobrevibacter curvatus]